MRKIVTSPTHSSLPDRSHDFCAHYEGDEEAGEYGYGATEADAIRDFLENREEDGAPKVFLISVDEGVLFDPDGKFHGWIMRRHPDGMWISVRKLDAVDPEDHPVIRALSSSERTDG